MEQSIAYQQISLIVYILKSLFISSLQMFFEKLKEKLSFQTSFFFLVARIYPLIDTNQSNKKAFYYSVFFYLHLTTFVETHIF